MGNTSPLPQRLYSEQLFDQNVNPINRLVRIDSVDQLSPSALFMYKNRNNLLAFDFFWVSKVNQKNLLTYFQRVADLHELFITPHLTVDNQLSCSFLKKFEFKISTSILL